MNYVGQVRHLLLGREREVCWPECAEECPAKGVKIGVSVVWVLPKALQAGVVVRAGSGPAGIPAEQVVLGLLALEPVGAVVAEGVPGLVGQLAPGAVPGEVPDALVGEEAHVHLNKHQNWL